METGSEKPVRADAQRSIDALIEAARDVFVTDGVDAPVRAIAQKAGVGIGTVYRNFPNRSDLISAVFRREIDDCADAAVVLAARHDPFEALSEWLKRYVNFLATKKGFAAALHSGDDAYAPLPAHVRARFGPAVKQLVNTAIAANAIRADTNPDDILRAVGNLATGAYGSDAKHAQQMVSLLMDGLRFGVDAER